MHRIDAAYCYTCRTFCGLCVCVCGFGTSVNPAKKDESIDMLFGADSRGPRQSLLDGVHTGVIQRIQLNDPCTVLCLCWFCLLQSSITTLCVYGKLHVSLSAVFTGVMTQCEEDVDDIDGGDRGNGVK